MESNNYYDIAINGGKVCFFNPDHFDDCNIGIKDGKICAITRKAIRANKIIEVKNKIVAPGFIDFHSHVDGKLYSGECMVLHGATTTIGGERGFNSGIMRKLHENGFVINQGNYVSHSFLLRKAVGIHNPYSCANKIEIRFMMELAEEFFRNGAFGIHFGLEFVPGTSIEEILLLASVAAKYGKPIIIHSRKDGKEALKSIKEVIEISRQTNAPIHILHLEYMVGYDGVMEKALEMLNNAIEKGADVSADTGLYDAFPTCIGSSILDEGWQRKYRQGTNYENLIISSGLFAGKKCTKMDFEYLRNMLPNTLVTAFVLDVEPIVHALKEPFIFVSTNGADGPHYIGAGHPETAGTFPRLIRKYVREDKVISLIEAIKKCTYNPSKRFGIKNKGCIKKGYDADLVIFDYDTIFDRADYINYGDPNEPPIGIEYVLVNGKIVVQNGSLSGEKNAGRVLNS